MKSQASRSIQELPGCLNCKNASSHRTENKSNWIRFGLFKRFYLGWDLDRSALFPQKNCPFPLRWVTLLCHTKFHTDLFPCRCGSRCFGAKWQLAFWPDLMYFPPFFFCVETQEEKKNYFHFIAHLLPFQWCVTLFYFISFVHFHHCYSLWFTAMATERSLTSIWNGTEENSVIISGSGCRDVY